MIKIMFSSILFLLLTFSFISCAPVKYTIEEPQQNLSAGEETQVQVLAAADWKNSGVIVKKGEKYKINASGKWHVGGLGGWCNWCGPDGIGIYHTLCWNDGITIVKGFTHGALIAKIGQEGVPFGIGDSFELNANKDGILFFRINDWGPWDNKGAVNVTVRKIFGTASIITSQGTVENIVKGSAETGMQPRIAVLSLKSTTKAAIEEGYGDMVSEMLITGLIKTGRFEVLERAQIKQILNERQFSEADVVAGESAVNVGKMLRVKYLVMGSVAKIQNFTEVDVRFVDTESGKALLAENVSCQSLGDLRNSINHLVNKISSGYPGKL